MDQTTCESAQLIDYIAIQPRVIGENQKKLASLWVEKGESLREVSRATGHSREYLRKQLRKFGIQKEKSPPRVVPFGWSWKSDQLVENAKEQAVIREILILRAGGMSLKEIAAELNRRAVPTKDKGRWWHSTMGRVLSPACANHQEQVESLVRTKPRRH